MLNSTLFDTLSLAKEDTLVHAGNDGSGGEWILHHVMDANSLEFPPFGTIYLPRLELFGFDISITKHVFFMWVIAIILVVILSYVAKSYKKSLVPKGLTNLIEIIIVFVRDEIIVPTVGKGYEKFVPYLMTVFFFILFSNFIGLFPYSSTITSNITVTATLAGFTFIVTQIGGIMHHGFFGYLKGLVPPGIPVLLLPIIIPIEILGLFTKPFALCIRLFANMSAGHIVILSLIGLIFIMKSIYVAPVSVAFALFIFLLEILVALIQAYVFTMLSALFIGMAIHQDH